jgi:hypothetical protein
MRLSVEPVTPKMEVIKPLNSSSLRVAPASTILAGGVRKSAGTLAEPAAF